MILSCALIKKYKVLLDIINNSITFFLKYCIYLKAHIFPITLKTEGINIISQAKL